MIVAIALWPSLVTVIWVVPAPTAVTRPSELTEAIPGFALDDVTTRPVSTLPFASRAVTSSWTVAPMMRLDDAGETETDATGTGGGGGGGAGAVTMIVAIALLPSLVTVIWVVPSTDCGDQT